MVACAGLYYAVGMESPVLQVRMPADLLERLKAQAEKESRAVSNLVVAILKRALPDREKAVTQ